MTDATPAGLDAKDPHAVQLTAAIQAGAAGEQSHLLNEEPGLVSARIAARPGGWRTPLHLATDWPGYYPDCPAIVRLLIEAGGDPSARSDEGPSETPLHWAASTDDVDVAAVLIDAGADIEAPGASIAGGARSATQSATAAGMWHGCSSSEVPAWTRSGAGRRARHARAHGELLSAQPPSRQDLDEAFWQACHGSQLEQALGYVQQPGVVDAEPDQLGVQRAEMVLGGLVGAGVLGGDSQSMRVP